MQVDDVFDIAQFFLVGVFTTVIIYYVGITIIGGEMKPLITELNPNSSVGIGPAQYNSMTDDIWNGLKYFFYIIFVVVGLWLIVKLLYNREETSYQYSYTYG